MKQTKYTYKITKKKYFFHIHFALLLFTSFSAFSQKKDNTNFEFTPMEIWESGLPYIENYTPDDYKGGPQNWALLEGNDGFMYAGNSNGILQYDGVTWNTIELKNQSFVSSLTKTGDEKIFVGGVQEIGYLEPDELGEMQLHSLMPYLKTTNSEFGSIWSTVSVGNNIFFACDKYLFRWNGKKFKIWLPKDYFGAIFKVNGNLYINSLGVGIHKVDGDSLNLIPGGDLLKNEIGRIDVMLPYQNDKILIIHSRKGLLLYDGKQITSFNEKSNNEFQKHRIFKGVTLSNGDYAMATIASGLYIVNGKTGQIKKRIGKRHGLISDQLLSICEDQYGTIWVGADHGISKIDWKSPFRILNETSGLGEGVGTVSYINRKFIVDSNGLYQLVRDDLHKENNELIFKKIEGIETKIRSIIPFNDNLLAFSSTLIYKINNKNKVQQIKDKGWSVSSIIKSTIDNSKFYAGTLEGTLFECELSGNQWLIKPLFQIDGEIGKIVEEPQGNLWLATNYKALYFAKKQQPNGLDEKTNFELKKYDTLSGLPNLTSNVPNLLSDKLYVTTTKGLYHFNRITQTFIQDTIMMGQYDKTIDDFGPIGFANNGEIWQTVKAGFKNKVYIFSKNKLSELSEYNLFSDFQTDRIEFLDDIVLFVGINGILLYNKNTREALTNKNLTTNLRKVWVNNDSLVYAGSNRYKTKEDSFEIPFKNNTLKFEYTLPFYNKSENNTYQYYLEGFDTDWSSWTSEAKKEYTNIPEGDYNFKVRSKNIFNHTGIEDRYSFIILPPWYNTWWMYLIYGFGAIALVVFTSRLWSNQLRKKNIVLEAVVKERTAELLQKNFQLENQSEQLKVADKMKTHLYANISHEFRTPLTLINGLSKVLMEQDFKEENIEKLKGINYSGNQLLHLVNQMLELVSFDANKGTVSYKNADIINFIKKSVSFYKSFTSSKEQNLKFSSDVASLNMDFDDDKLQKIVNNILSNATKFTPKGGTITVKISVENQNLIITIADTGKGITAEHLPHIFERHYRTFDIDNNLGNGIGMALTKELIKLLKGTVSVESVLERGTVFTINLPIKNTIKKSDEVVHRIPFIEKTKVETEYTENEKSTHTILLVEDNIEIQNFIKLLLGNRYTIYIANNGVEGLEIAKNKNIDFIISDVMMPKMNGFEFCKHIKNDVKTSHIPFIIISARTTVKDKLEGYQLGIDAYLFKPFDKDELQLVIRNLLRKKEEQTIYFSKLLGLKKQATEVTNINQLDVDFIKSIQEIALSSAKMNVDQIAKKLAISRTQLHTKTKTLTGKSITHYINHIRIEKAKTLLKESTLQINEMAFELGFESANYFTRIFKKETGKTPIAYRENPLS